jgi:hypothetical protein
MACEGGSSQLIQVGVAWGTTIGQVLTVIPMSIICFQLFENSVPPWRISPGYFCVRGDGIWQPQHGDWSAPSCSVPFRWWTRLFTRHAIGRDLAIGFLPALYA